MSLMQIKVDIDTFDLLQRFGPNGKRAFNKAVRAGMEAKVATVEAAVKRRAPRDTGLLSESVGVVVKGGPGGAAHFTKMIAVVKNTEAAKYWLVREFGPRGGVIRGKPIMTFAFRRSPFFGKDVKAGEVRANPTMYGFDYTLMQGNMIFGVKRKTGKSWEQLYPNAKPRKPRLIRGGKGIPTRGNPNMIPLFAIVRAVSQRATPYIRPTFHEKAAEVQQSIVDHIMEALK